MNVTPAAPAPATEAVAIEQIRTVGLAIRWEARAFVALAVLLPPAVAALVTFAPLQVDGGAPVLDPGDALGILALVLAAAFPLGVWKGERPFGESQIWWLPVAHRRHALLKVAAGWVWLMALVALGLLSIAIAVALGGGVLGVEGTRMVVADAVPVAAGAPPGLEPVAWVTPWWQWALPFTSATAAYLLASALLLGVRHPVRWVAAAWMGMLGMAVVAEEADVAWLTAAYDTLAHAVDVALTGGADTLRQAWRLPSGERVTAWEALPSLGRWASITALWLAIGLAALVTAAGRDREA